MPTNQSPPAPPRTPNTSFFSGIILAAGKSTRMGRLKQLLPLDGRPLLQHVIDATVASCLDEIVLVLGHRADEVRKSVELRGRVRVVVNADFAAGQSGSLECGLQAADARSGAAVILLGDQPRVTTALIDRVVGAAAREPAPILRPLFTSPAGRVPGHPVVLSRLVWSDVMRLSGDEGARSLMSSHPEWVRELVLEIEAPKDVDTWEEYESV